MKSFIVLAVAILQLSMAIAQTPASSSEGNQSGWQVKGVNGGAFLTIKYKNLVSGSPYYLDDYSKATILTAKGTEFKNVSTKLDLVDGTVHYKDSSGNDMIATNSIKQISFTDDKTGVVTVFQHSTFFNKGSISSPDNWLMPLEIGTVGLYKQLYKTVTESSPYNDATTNLTIKTTNRYFILKDNSFVPFKKWSDLQEILSDKKTDISQFLESHTLKGKSESDYRQLVSFYNALPR